VCDWIKGNVTEIISVVAIILSPIVAVLVGQILQDRAKKQEDKINILKIFMKYRREIVECFDGKMSEQANDEVYKALNLIDVVFYKHPEVREKWSALSNIFIKMELTDESQKVVMQISGEAQKIKKDFETIFRELVIEIAKTVKYKFTFD